MAASGRGAGAQQPVRVIVVDDHAFFRDGLIRGLRESGYLQVVGEAESGREGLALIEGERPDVAVLDYQMPDLTGLDVVRAVAQRGLSTRTVILSAVTDSAVVFQALAEGARGYVSKDARRSEIVDAVRRVGEGQTVVPSELASGLADQIRLHTTTAGPLLSERERQVLSGFARGLSIPELAAELYLSASTVKTHTQRLYEKLGVSDRAAAVAEGMRRGLLE
jgi:two-component system nitrate/nitrite response regulator NarL